MIDQSLVGGASLRHSIETLYGLPAVLMRDKVKSVATESPLNTNAAWWDTAVVKVEVDGGALWLTGSVLKYKVSIQI